MGVNGEAVGFDRLGDAVVGRGNEQKERLYIYTACP